MTNFIFIMIGFLALIILVRPTDNSTLGSDYQNDPLPRKIASLPEMNLQTVNSYEDYKDLVDKTNDIILILNEQGNFDIPKLKDTQEAYGEVSKKIIKYTPLIDNYNDLIKNAKIYIEENSEANYQNFYSSLGKFSLETSVIGITLFYSLSYKTVGILYQSSGLSSIATKCPSCVSVALSNAYWTAKTVLVEESSKIAENLINETVR